MRKFATAFICLLFFIALPVAAVDDTVIDLNNQIQTKQQELETLKKRIETYQNAIVDKQNQVSSLRNQLNILDDKIEQAALELEANELKLNTVTLQIQAVTLDIAAREADISQKKSQISELVRQLYQADQKTLLEVLVLNSSLGAFFDQLNYLEELEKALQNDIADLKIVKAELVRQQQNLASYRVQLVKSREEIELAKANLESEQQTKALILQQTGNQKIVTKRYSRKLKRSVPRLTGKWLNWNRKSETVYN